MERNSVFSRWRTMATYSGFYSVDPDFSLRLNEKLSSGKLRLGALQIPEPARTKARELLKNLPAGCKILGAAFPADWPVSVEQPGVMVVEGADVSHLSWFNNYYGGPVQFQFHHRSRYRVGSSCLKKARKWTR
jgi:hypothetical protein